MHLDASRRCEENNLRINDAFLRSCLEEARFSDRAADELLEASRSAAVKDALKQRTMDAVDAGVFGSPTLIVSGLAEGGPGGEGGAEGPPMSVFGR